MAKRRFSSRLASYEITTRGIRALTCVKCTAIMIAELTVMRGLGSSRVVDFWCGMVWF
jgi:hypothetical protein